MENLTSLMPAIAPVLAAAITAVIAFVVSVLAKEHKTSEFRQAWIEGVRSDVASLLGDFNTLEMGLDIATQNSLNKEHWNDLYDEYFMRHRVEYAKVDALCNSVILRLNPVEHKELIGKLRKLEASVAKGADEVHLLCADLVDDFSVVLKNEWGRVKSGEPAFKAMKKFAVVVFGVTVALSLVLLIGSGLLQVTGMEPVREN